MKQLEGIASHHVPAPCSPSCDFYLRKPPAKKTAKRKGAELEEPPAKVPKPEDTDLRELEVAMERMSYSG